MKNFCTWLFLVLSFATFSQQANASKRSYLSLSVAVIQADAIVEARTTHLPRQLTTFASRSAEVQIKRVFKGTPKTGTLTLGLPPLQVMVSGRLEMGKDYLFFLRTVGGEATKYEVMFDGTRPSAKEDAHLIATAIELTPAWSPSQNGLSTLLTAEKFRVKAAQDLNLWIGYKNTSAQNITLQYRDWPLETHTHWTLKVKSSAGKVVEAVPHPKLSRQDITDYFSRFPRSYEIILKPQQQFFFPLFKINSAKPGWGYKEELDFQFYPMTKSGNYTIAATGHNFGNHSPPTATGLKVWLE